MAASDTLLPKNTALEVEDLVCYYHAMQPKIKYKEICTIISSYHLKAISMSMLKGICKKRGLTRKRNVSPENLRSIIENEFSTSLSCVGYRQMTENICLKFGINVSREEVRRVLKEVDPHGVQKRRRNTLVRREYQNTGPGAIYHMDGNDKLKRWGFGCVDGFSRKLLWLFVASSNNDPLIIAHYYIQCIRKYRLAPKRLRMDKGRENIYCEDIQVFLTEDDDSFIYAASTRNQRIEAYWSRIKKFRLQWWINFFTDIVDRQLYRPNLETHQECLLFCFLPIIQRELNEFYKTWNLHNVRQSSCAPGGKPDILFGVPSVVGHRNHGIHVNDEDLDIVSEVLGIDQYPVYRNKDMHDLLICYVHINDITIAKDAEGGIDMYIKLLQCLENDGFMI